MLIVRLLLWMALIGPCNAQFAIFQTAAGSDPTVNVLPSFNDAYANWSKAGLVLVGGIPNRSTACTTAQAGVTMPLAPSGGDDVSQINTAISNCPLNSVVNMTTGTFKSSGQTANHAIFINRGITLRGGDSCNGGSSPYCGTVIQVTPGGSTQTYNTGGSNCSLCNASYGPTINIAPQQTINGNHPNTWSGCAWSTSCNGSGGTIALTSDGLQGQSTISVASTSGFTVGMWVRIDENSGATTYTGPLGTSIFAASDLTNNSGSPPTGKVAYAGASVEDGVAYGALYDRETSEIHKVSAIGTGTLTFDSPLTINYRVSHAAQVYQPNNAFTTMAGVENISIVGSPGGQIGGPVRMEFCAYCWLKNIETQYWIGGIIITNSARVQVTGSYLHDCSDCENNGNEYPIALDGATTETLFDNNIFLLAGKGMVGRSCGGGNVVAYNYQDRTFYQASNIGNYWIDMGINGSHYVGCHHALFEGNWADAIGDDNTHGNIVYHTYFRNWSTGLRTNFNDPSLGNPASSTYTPADQAMSDTSRIAFATGNSYPYASGPGNQRGGGPMALDYWHAFVANVMGSPGVTCVTGCTSTGWAYQHNGQQNHTVWMLGWVGGGSNDPNLTGAGTITSTMCNGVSPPNCSYFFRHGNYDVVNAGIVDYQTGYSTTIPSTFYLLSGAPSYFGTVNVCSYSWPWVTPSLGTVIQDATGSGCTGYTALPAQARFAAGTPFVQP
jgi:hypothetical protein